MPVTAEGLELGIGGIHSTLFISLFKNWKCMSSNTLFIVAAFILGLGLGLGGTIYYMRWKAKKAMKGAQDMMENAFDDLPDQ